MRKLSGILLLRFRYIVICLPAAPPTQDNTDLGICVELRDSIILQDGHESKNNLTEIFQMHASLYTIDCIRYSKYDLDTRTSRQNRQMQIWWKKSITHQKRNGEKHICEQQLELFLPFLFIYSTNEKRQMKRQRVKKNHQHSRISTTSKQIYNGKQYKTHNDRQ